MEYAVDLSAFTNKVIDKFFCELESKTSICWSSGQKPTQFKMSGNFHILKTGYKTLLQGLRIESEIEIELNRAQFIEKMATLYPIKKQDIHEYCKEHRVWAAKDGDGRWWGWPKKPESTNNLLPDIWNSDRCIVQSLPNDLNYPDVPWDKSLIAPDGSMLLWDETRKTQKRATHFEVGKWYLAKAHKERGPGKLLKIQGFDQPYLLYHPEWKGGHDADAFGSELHLSGNHAYWYDEQEIIETKAPIERVKDLQRGDPVFVWDDGDDLRCPAIVRYFYAKREKGCSTFSYAFYGVRGINWDHYRPFDASLVGVPRKDWPPLKGTN